MVADTDAGDGCRVVIDLRVTKDSRHNAPDPTKQLPAGVLVQQVQQETKEWSLSRDHVPYALAQRGITLQDWTNVFDKADALWERRTMERIEGYRELDNRRMSTSSYMIAFYLVTFGLLGAIIILGFIFGKSWMVGLGLGSMMVVPIVTESRTLANAKTTLEYLFIFYWMHWIFSSDFIPNSVDSWQKLVMVLVVMLFLPIVAVLVATQTKGKAPNFHSSKCFETLALCEDDWSRLADDQRCVFQSFGVDVVPIKEVTTTKGRYHVWTVGLRFSFDMMPSTNNNSNTEENMLTLSNGPSTPDAAIHDLDRLLHLNQSGDAKTAEYRLLISRILSTMSLPKNGGARPVGSKAVMTAVEADTDTGDEKQVFMEIV